MSDMENQYLIRKVQALEARVAVLSRLIQQQQAMISQGISLGTKISDGRGHYGTLGDIFACAKSISNDPTNQSNTLVIRPEAKFCDRTGAIGRLALVSIEDSNEEWVATPELVA